MHYKTVIFILLSSFFLRIYLLNSIPSALYWEEVALGYDAYSIFTTGKDHHGSFFPVVAFESFGDYKPTLYFYSIIPFLLFFGLSVWSVRLPSVLAGVAIVYFSGKIAGLFFSPQKNNAKKKWQEVLFQPDILTMLFTAFSPWALQFSRGGWEVNLATALLTAGLYFGLLAGKIVADKFKVQKVVFSYYLLSVIFLVVSAYTYHATRLIAPLLGVVLAFPLLKNYQLYWKQICLLCVLAIVLMLPILLFIQDPSVGHRLQETSTFSTGKEVLASNFYLERFGSNVLSRMLFHRYWFYLRTILMNAFSHFRLDFLFLSGDKIYRHSIQYFGLFFPTDFFVLIAGFVTLLQRWKRQYHFLWLWLIIGVIPASVSQPVPHALRTLPILPIYMILLGLGLSSLLHFIIKNRFSKAVIVTMLGIMSIELLMYWHFYVSAYPKLSAHDWQYGYEQMVKSIEKNRQPGEKTFITREYGRPAMYYWFFTQAHPNEFQAEQTTASKDQGEFLNFKNVSFPNNLSGNEKGLIASTPQQRQQFLTAIDLETVYDLQGRPIWVIYRAK